MPDPPLELFIHKAKALWGGETVQVGANLFSGAFEERHTISAGLIIEDNVASVAPGFQWTSAFVGDWSGEALVMRNNRLGDRITAFERHPAR